MRLFPLVFAFFLLTISASATDRFVRNDGHNTNCDGLVDAADPGSGATPRACAFASVQVALDAVVAGDTVKVKAGHTFDGTFTLPDKSCTEASPCTLTSTAAASLPNGQVGPAVPADTISDSANMPRLRTLGSGGAPTLNSASNNEWWIVDGIEITDNSAGTDTVAWVVDWTQAGLHDFTIKRCWIHQKETGTDYFRTIERGVGWNGDDLTVKWNYIYLIGYYKIQSPSTYTNVLNTAAVTVSGSTDGNVGLLVEDNYISVWYSAFFFGGQDTDAVHTATLTAGATTTAATFSNTTGLSAGDIILLSINVSGTLGTFAVDPGWDQQVASFTRTGGAVLTDADAGTNADPPGGIGTAMHVISGSPQLNVDFLEVISGNDYLVRLSTSWDIPGPSGPYDWELLTSVMIDTVNHGTGEVTYHAYGVNGIAQAPSTPGKAQWSTGDEGLVNDVVVRKNTFHIDPVFALHAKVNNGSGPKGYWEIKNVNRMTIEGNRFTGWPATLAWTGSNQNGGSPWTTIKHIDFVSNWYEPDFTTDTDSELRGPFIITVNVYRTATLAADVKIHNNVFMILPSLINPSNVNDGLQIYHNTILNYYEYFGPYYNIGVVSSVANNFVFKDNIVGYSQNGIACDVPPNTLATCYPSGIFLNNLVVDTWTPPQGVVSSTWGTGSVLAPVPTTWTAIGFTNLAGKILSLAPATTYKNTASDNTDPGVDWVTLNAALGEGILPAASVRGKLQMRGKVTMRP